MRSRFSRATMLTNSISAPARSMVAGTQNSRSLCGSAAAAVCNGISPSSTSYDDGVPGLAVGDAQRGAGVALRVQIDDERLESLDGQRGGQVHRGGRLAHAALLVGDREKSAMARAGQWRVGGVQHLHRALGGGADRGVEFVRCFT